MSRCCCCGQELPEVPTRQQTRTLFISAGHSDTDPGAVGINGMHEADYVLGFRDRLFAYLTAQGITVARDGQGSQNLPLDKAAAMAGAYDVAVEFHLNAFDQPTATGVETLSAVVDQPFGERLCNAVVAVLGIANRGAKDEGDGAHSRLAFVQAGGLIHELFFVTNENDVQQALAHQDGLVEAVGDVLIAEVCQ